MHYLLRKFAPHLMPLTLSIVALSQSFCVGPLQAARPGYEAIDTLMPPAGGAVTIQNQSAYQSYHASTLNDARGMQFVRNAYGKACQRGISIPLSALGNFISANGKEAFFSPDVRWGEGTLDQAMAQATAHARADELLTDVTLDMQQTAILGVLYRETCLIVRGRIMAPTLPKTLIESTLPLEAPEVVGEPPILQ